MSFLLQCFVQLQCFVILYPIIREQLSEKFNGNNFQARLIGFEAEAFPQRAELDFDKSRGSRWKSVGGVSGAEFSEDFMHRKWN